MHLRRQKLTQWIALQASAATGSDPHQVTDFNVFPLREPVSKRAYTLIRLRTRSGLTGYGECAGVTAAELDKARRAVLGQPATSFGVITTQTSLDGAITAAMMDIAARAAKTPVYRLLGGPTRTKVRALASLTGGTDDELKASMATAQKTGYRAFQVPVPLVNARNQGQAFDRAVKARMQSLRSGTDNADFVLDGGGRLTAGDASSVAATLERFHLLWFNEPCAATNMRTIQKISDECVTPLGFGRDISDPSIYQDLLREGVVDILRPDLQRTGIPTIRRIASLAETYYTAVAPNHEGGPIGTAIAIQLAASLPNFFIQHVPVPAAEQDRRMRSEMAGADIEAVRDGFLALPKTPGLGVEINEASLDKYKDRTA
jgi:galactonate dehydratase